MPRRRKGRVDSGVNLDSLMDALTNVVAVLILVLILVQADVGKKVVEFLEGLEPATPDQVAKAEKRVARLRSGINELDRLLAREAPDEKKLEAERRQLALLEKKTDQRKDLLVKLDQLREAAQKEEARRDAEAARTEKIQKEIARLEALLDETPVLEVEPTVVEIPASRPLPKDAEVYYAIVFNDRVHVIDPFTPVELFEHEFQRSKSQFPNRRIKREGADPIIYEPGPILKHFEKFDFRNSRQQKHELVAWPTSTRLKIIISPDLENGGTPLEDLKSPRNPFSRIVSRLRLKRNGVLIFWVHPNSFNTYLLARRLTDRANLAAGWKIASSRNYQVTIPDIEIRRLKKPVPREDGGGKKPPPLPTKID